MKIDYNENMLNIETFFSEVLDYKCYWTKYTKWWNSHSVPHTLVLEISSIHQMIKLLDKFTKEKYNADEILKGNIPVPNFLYKCYGLIPLENDVYEKYSLCAPKEMALSCSNCISYENDDCLKNKGKLFNNIGLTLGFTPRIMVANLTESRKPKEEDSTHFEPYDYDVSAFSGYMALPYLFYFLYCYDRNSQEFQSVPKSVVIEIENFLKEKNLPIFDEI